MNQDSWFRHKRKPSLTAASLLVYCEWTVCWYMWSIYFCFNPPLAQAGETIRQYAPAHCLFIVNHREGTIKVGFLCCLNLQSWYNREQQIRIPGSESTRSQSQWWLPGSFLLFTQGENWKREKSGNMNQHNIYSQWTCKSNLKFEDWTNYQHFSPHRNFSKWCGKRFMILSAAQVVQVRKSFLASRNSG